MSDDEITIPSANFLYRLNFAQRRNYQTILILRVLGYVQNSVLTANFIAPLD